VDSSSLAYITMVKHSSSVCVNCSRVLHVGLGMFGHSGKCLKCACADVGTEVHPILSLIIVAAMGIPVSDVPRSDLNCITVAGVSQSSVRGNRFRMLVVAGNSFLSYRLSVHFLLTGDTVAKYQHTLSTSLCRSALAEVYDSCVPDRLMVMARSGGVVESDGVKASIIAAIVGLVVDISSEATAAQFASALFPCLLS